MTCPNCGTSNLDTATLCINCGRPLTGAPPAASQSSAPPPPPSQSPSQSYVPPPQSYTPPPVGPAGVPPPGGSGPVVILILSILMLLCCCNPVALVPLVFAIMARSRRSAGDYAGAQLNASRAMLWFWIALIAVIIWNVVFFMFLGGMDTIEQIREQIEASR